MPTRKLVVLTSEQNLLPKTAGTTSGHLWVVNFAAVFTVLAMQKFGVYYITVHVEGRRV